MMHQYINDLLENYPLHSASDYENALKEIVQQVVLCGLWRTDFFNHCAFYGGTALRIFYNLQRFSEDLDFTLTVDDDNFRLADYFQGINQELISMGFDAEITRIEKKKSSQIESAFVKANTMIHMIEVGAPQEISSQIHVQKQIKIKLEVDLLPPLPIETEIKFLLQPIPCSIRVVRPDYLFAGKVHALLYRKWQKRVKGRDWYDLVWFIKKNIPLHLQHLVRRMVQTDDWLEGHVLNKEEFINLFNNTIDKLDIEQAKNDLLPFLKNPDEIKIWSKEFFKTIIQEIQVK